MSVIFSRSCEYAVQASLFLAHQAQDHFVPLRDISDKLGIPYHFLSKILQTLVRADIVISCKGTNGGFALSRPAREVTLMDIVQAVDGEKLLHECVLGFPGCSGLSPCPVHSQWNQAKRIIMEMLRTNTLSNLGEDLNVNVAPDLSVQV